MKFFLVSRCLLIASFNDNETQHLNFIFNIKLKANFFLVQKLLIKLLVFLYRTTRKFIKSLKTMLKWLRDNSWYCLKRKWCHQVKHEWKNMSFKLCSNNNIFHVLLFSIFMLGNFLLCSYGNFNYYAITHKSPRYLKNLILISRCKYWMYLQNYRLIWIKGRKIRSTLQYET